MDEKALVRAVVQGEHSGDAWELLIPHKCVGSVKLGVLKRNVLTRAEMRGEVFSILAAWRRELWAEASGDMIPGASTPTGTVTRRILDLFFSLPCATCGDKGEVYAGSGPRLDSWKPCPDCGEDNG